MTKKAKIIGIIVSFMTVACIWTVGQAHAVFAAVRLTSAIQKGTTSQSTRRALPHVNAPLSATKSFV